MAETTQTQFKVEGQPAFPTANKENDNSSTSSTDQTNGDQTQSHEGEQTQADKKDGAEVGKGDLHEEPRWKEREEDWKSRFNKQEERHVQELQKIREDFDTKFGELDKKGSLAPKDVPAWFGGDESQWSDFAKYNEGLISQAEERAYKRLTSTQAEEQKRIGEATSYFNEQVIAIESDKDLNPRSEKVDRNKLLKAALDFDLVDSQGRWNYKAAWQFLRNQASPANNQDRKNLANATTSDRRAETKQTGFVTSSDFQNPANRPW